MIIKIMTVCKSKFQTKEYSLFTSILLYLYGLELYKLSPILLLIHKSHFTFRFYSLPMSEHSLDINVCFLEVL